jgi:3-oxoadipate enol-lactonase
MHETVSGVLRLADCDIYYEMTGMGPAIVFAHGLGGHHGSWWQQTPHFAERFTCVTFAHRGFLPSTNRSGNVGPDVFAEDLGALIDHLGFSNVSLVAQSMGGWTCLTYALRNPARVSGLVMSATSGTINYRLIDHPEMRRIGKWDLHAERTKTELMKAGINAAAGRTMAAEQPELYARYQYISGTTPAAYKQLVRASLMSTRVLPPSTLDGFGVPTLFIAGEEDLLFPPGGADAMASIVPRGISKRIPQSGHAVYFERADIFNHHVDSFLDSFS